MGDVTGDCVGSGDPDVATVTVTIDGEIFDADRELTPQSVALAVYS